MDTNSTENNKNAKKLLIIGNGFDLACGLRSSFHDFFKKVNADQLRNLLQQINDEVSYQFSKSLKKGKDSHITSDFISTLEETFKPFKAHSQDIFYNFWMVLLILNNLFDNSSSFPASDWIDVETDMYNFFNSSETPTTQNKATYSEFSDNDFQSLASQRIFKLFLYLVVNSENLPSSLPYSDLSYYATKKYHPETWQNFIQQELKEFETKFAKYLEDQIKNTDDYVKHAEAYLNLLSNGEPFNLLSFNYTNLTTTTTNSKIIRNIHGTLDTHPIIGIDQRDIDFDTEIVRYTKTYRIMSEYKKNYRNLFCPEIKEIVFFGHSLGKQDSSYFTFIFDHYNIYDSDIKIVFAYTIYDQEIKEEIISNNYDAVTQLLNDYGKTFNDKDHGKNIMRKLLLEGRLELRKIDYLNTTTSPKQ